MASSKACSGIQLNYSIFNICFVNSEFSVSGDLFVLVFSMDSRESFEEVIRLREQILETKMSAAANSGGRASKRNIPRVPMAIAGNKCDKELG